MNSGTGSAGIIVEILSNFQSGERDTEGSPRRGGNALDCPVSKGRLYVGPGHMPSPVRPFGTDQTENRVATLSPCRNEETKWLIGEHGFVCS